MNPMFTITNEDCMAMMSRYPDKHFQLGIIDPPYGIDVNSMPLGSGKYKTEKKWDDAAPGADYFRELFRVADKVILWRANHYVSKIPHDSSCWMVWDKRNGDSDFADAELAWTNLECPVRMFSFHLAQQSRMEIKDRFHVTQKPISLYRWCLTKFAKPGWRILDTHLGSGSHACAIDEVNKFEKMGLTLTASEIDTEYYEKALAKILKHQQNETNLFG